LGKVTILPNSLYGTLLHFKSAISSNNISF
jgi:hypothetical protein